MTGPKTVAIAAVAWLGALFAASCGGETSCGEACPCTTVSDCPGEDGPCRFRACRAGVCAIDVAPAGADCAAGLCNGAGSCVAPFSWTPIATTGAPSPRSAHSAIWSGARMLVWGGHDAAGPLGDGAAYDPAADGWTPIASAGAPSPRFGHTAVFTGESMIVWGGYGDGAFRNDGAIYEVASDSWRPMTTTEAPLGRNRHTAVWADGVMIVFGGLNGSAPVDGGASYNPASDSWTPLPGEGAPPARMRHAAVWTGVEMLVWGGTNTFDWLDEGKHYHRASNSWTKLLASANAPYIRETFSFAWTGAEMLVWGGWDGGNYLRSGGIYTPSSPDTIEPAGGWVAMSEDGAPSGRADHASIYSGDELFVWGGCGGAVCDELRADGGRFTPSANGGAWLPVPPSAALSARREHSAVYTGSEVIVWGGRGEATTRFGDGARGAL